MESLEKIQIRLDQISENKVFIGILMLLVNVGARFIIEELSDNHRAIVKGDNFRKIVIFASVFMATSRYIYSINSDVYVCNTY